MKKWLAISLALCMLFSCAAAQATYTAGTYSASAKGNNGDVTVEVVLTDVAIESVEVTGHNETAGIADAPIKEIPEKIVETQSLAVDTITGATNTSNAILAAVADCVAQADGDVAALSAVKDTPVSDAKMVPGIYEGSARGFAGYSVVHVTVSEDAILKVDIVKCTDAPENITKAAVKAMPQRIVDAQSIEVDVVAGATFTSQGILNAAAEALQKAGNVEKFSVKPEPVVKVQGEDVYVDVLVVGGGAAGSSAALYAQNGLDGEDTGLKVMLVEKLGMIGGSSMLSQGWIMEFRTHDLTTEEEKAAFVEEYISTLSPDSNVALQRNILAIGNETLDTMRNLGLQLIATNCYPDTMVNWIWPYINPSPEEGEWGQAGANYGTFYTQRFKESKVDVRVNTEATELIVEDGVVKGAKVTDLTSTYNVFAKKVILACGGMSNNPELLAQMYPEEGIAGNASFVSGGADGDAFKLTAQFNPKLLKGGVMAGGYLGGEFRYGLWNDLRNALYVGANATMVVNRNGERFTNDGAGYNTSDMYFALSKQPGKIGYMIMDSSNPAVEDVKATKMPEIVHTADTLEGLAEQLGIPADALIATAQSYVAIASGETDAFGVTAETMTTLENGPYYAVHIIPLTLGVNSGMVVGEHCEMLDGEGNVVENLYIVGETMYEGSTLPNAIWTGRIAGEHAAAALTE